MLKITKRIKEITRRFLARKRRINTRIKSANPEYRVVITKSNTALYAQVIDRSGHVVCAFSDAKIKTGTKKEKAMQAWQALAKLMLEKWIQKAAFDRNGELYHGRVKAFAEGLRSWSIQL